MGHEEPLVQSQNRSLARWHLRQVALSKDEKLKSSDSDKRIPMELELQEAPLRRFTTSNGNQDDANRKIGRVHVR